MSDQRGRESTSSSAFTEDTIAASPRFENLFGTPPAVSGREDSVVVDVPKQTHVHVFYVRKSDNMLEKFTAKKAEVIVRVDTKERTVGFFYPKEPPETFSCAVITTRVSNSSIEILHLRIQTGNTRFSRRIIFKSEEDRRKFINVLEEGKLYPPSEPIGNGACPPASKLFPTEEDIVQSMNYDAQSKVPNLLGGEDLKKTVHRVTKMDFALGSERAVQGCLHITNYRIIFSPYDAAWIFGEFELPAAAVETIVKRGWSMIEIACKDIRVIKLAMHDAFTLNGFGSPVGPDSGFGSPSNEWLEDLIEALQPPASIEKLFAFQYQPPPLPSAEDDGWRLFSPISEYQRLGFFSVVEGRQYWRLYKNNNFRFSPTYPLNFIVPTSISEHELIQSAGFRSRARLPVPVWRHPRKHCVLARSSQPNYGVAGHRCESDRKLIAAFRAAAAVNSDSAVAPQLHIIDARKPIATKGNRLKGKGVENPQNYDGAIVEFMNIANIHAMRDSVYALRELVAPDFIADGDKNYHTRLENTRWLKHIMRILQGAARIAEVLDEEGASVLVHCSDGWDRTPQLVATAQLIMDPYYRTIRGFIVLVEKEWLSFGHKFAHRVGSGKRASDFPNERSPIMVQWIDAVWQITRQYPTGFEFNSKFLMHVVDSVSSGLYGTFLYNTERERIAQQVSKGTRSAWTPVLLNLEEYRNASYKPTQRILRPRANLKKIALWDELYCRFDAESHPAWLSFIQCGEGIGEDHFAHSTEVDPAIPIAESIETNPIDAAYPVDAYMDGIEIEDAVSREGDEEGSSSDENEPPSISIDEQEFKRRHTSVVSMDQLQRRTKEWARQRGRARQLSQSISLIPEPSRVRYLENMLNESMARELELETLCNSLAAQVDEISGNLTKACNKMNRRKTIAD